MNDKLNPITIPSFRKVWKLGYAQAAIKYPRGVLVEVCQRKKAVVDKERVDFNKSIFGKKNSNSGRVRKYDDDERREPKPTPLFQKIESVRGIADQQRIGEAFDRLTIFKNQLELDIAQNH